MKDCVSLEVAQELVASGRKDISRELLVNELILGFYAYNKDGELHYVHWDNDEGTIRGQGYASGGEKSYWLPAPTATQLAEELPLRTKITKYAHVYEVELYKNNYPKHNFPGWGDYMGSSSSSLADAMGKALLYLLENNLLTK